MNTLAQNLDDIEKSGVPELNARFANSGPGGVISAVLPYIFGAAAIAMLFYLIAGGFQLMTSRGDPKAIQAAQGKITNAILGFVITIAGFIVVGLLGRVLGIDVFSQIFGSGRVGGGR